MKASLLILLLSVKVFSRIHGIAVHWRMILWKLCAKYDLTLFTLFGGADMTALLWLG
jgi:hypothetical protein